MIENANAPDNTDAAEIATRGYRVLTVAEADQLGDSIRRGSPFAPGTGLPLDVLGQQLPFEAGVWQETMIGGLLASAIMVVLALLSLTIFPLGALIIAFGGCLLGLLATGTRKSKLAIAATVGNLLVLAIAFRFVMQ